MSASCKKPATAATPPTKLGNGILTRNEFTTSRLAEFASKEELTRLIGHGPEDWLIAALKELVDNGLDAAERAGVAPVIDVVVGEGFLRVSDNGPGMAVETIERVLDYSYRTSSNSAYVSPTPGQQGNALQTIFAMVHALSGKPGVTVIESRGVRHRIAFDVDPISREPRFEHLRFDIPAATGTSTTLFWPETPNENLLISLHNAAMDFLWSNPHVSLSFGSPGPAFRLQRTTANWRKWTPTDPTSPHWYDLQSLTNLIAAEINKARRGGSAQRTVADFVAEFRGLSGTGKRRDICEAVGATRERLDSFFDQGDCAIDRLLAAMQSASRPVKARDLGVIGEAHVLRMIGGEPSAWRYKKVEVDVDGVPYLIEAAFGFRPDTDHRTRIAALNWSASVGSNPFQHVGIHDEGLESILTDQRAGPDEPIAVFVHVATPRPTFLDKGKSTVDLPVEVEEAIVGSVRHVTVAWCKQRKTEEKEARAKLRRLDVMTARSKPMSSWAAAFSVMSQAYAKASGNGAWWAEARQIYYAARPDILRRAQVDTVDSGRFTQEFLIDYIREHGAECAGWKVAFDDRGHLVEPHTGQEIGLGTLAVRKYVGDYAKPEQIEGGFADPKISTHGPEGRYCGLLYIEKEGFDQLLDQAQIGNRFDLGIMSCKGMSVAAARELVDRTCARFKIPLFVLHDFDISGFSIASTLHQSNRRYQFRTASGKDFRVGDLGLRVADVERLGLQSEPVTLRGSREAIGDRLKINGATKNEIEYLLSGRRVELNAMTSPQFVALLEGKLTEHGVGKVIPDARDLANAYRLFERGARAKRVVEETLAATSREEIAAPADLEERVRAYLDEHPASSWDAAVAAFQAEDFA